MRAALVLCFVILLTELAWAPPSPTILLNIAIGTVEAMCLLLALLVQMVILLAARWRTYRPRRRTVMLLCILVLLQALYLLHLSQDAEISHFRLLTQNLYRVPGILQGLPPAVMRHDTDVDAGDLFDGAPPKAGGERGIRWLNAGRAMQDPDGILIDLRSPREYRAVTLTGAVNVPLEGLERGLAPYRQRRLYLFENGESLAREAARTLAARGYDAWFLRRGLAWGAYMGRGFYISDSMGNDLTGLVSLVGPPWSAESKEERRYESSMAFQMKGGRRLFDRVEVRALIEKGEAVLIDVRPGTATDATDIISLPVSRLPPAVLAARVAQLDAGRGYILACDDLVSSFEALRLGAVMEERGLRFLGRCTNPDALPYRDLPYFFGYGYSLKALLFKSIRDYVEYFLVGVSDALGVPPSWTFRAPLAVAMLHLLLAPLLWPRALQTARVRRAAVRAAAETSSERFSLASNYRRLRFLYRVHNFSRLLDLAPSLPLAAAFLWLTSAALSVPGDLDLGMFQHPAASIGFAWLAALTYYGTEVDQPIFLGGVRRVGGIPVNLPAAGSALLMALLFTPLPGLVSYAYVCHAVLSRAEDLLSEWRVRCQEGRTDGSTSP